jgi:REP element-mobilizing transposase RayT
MKFNPDIHHRHSIRLQGYDYSQIGAYFVTVCTKNRKCLFGDVVNGKMVLNDAGKMIEKWYFELTNKFHDIQCDQYIIMPNHIHFIIINVGADLRVCPDDMGEHIGSPLRVCPDDMGEHIGSPLHKIIQWFKTMTTNEYIRNVKNNGWEPFDKKLWQRNYYEHIICNEQELNKIREYIINNPLNWTSDENYCRGE